MKILKIWNSNISERQLKEITDTLENGEIIIIPTDTMYALACDALNVKAVEKLCRLKGINPDKQTLSILCRDIAMASEYSRIPNNYFRLMRDNTPGPFTFLLHSASSLPKAFKNRKTVGIRIPDSETDRAIINAFDRPLLSTSIGYKDEDYAVNTELIAETYSNTVSLMVDEEEGTTHLSTVIDCTGPEPEIVREGIGELRG